MNSIKIPLVAAGCVLIIVLAIFSGNSIGGRIESGDMLAAVKSAPSTSAINIFTRPKQAYLSLTSPLFNFISRIVNPIVKPLVKQSANPQEVLTITNSQPTAPVTNIENSLVNIFCSQKIGNLRKTITGSGVLIKNGLVLSDAHVGAYPLIADSNSAVTCLARTGSPAKATHSVKVLFISPEWVQRDGPHIASAYTETGQDDFAILKITPLVNGASQNSNGTLVPLPIQETVPSIGSTIKAAAYPANILGTKGVDAALYSQTEQITIRDLINFNGAQGTPSNADMIETSPNNIGQQGSSGGVIANQNNDIIGLISTVVSGSATGGNLIHGITIRGINDSLERYSNGGLSKLILLGTDELSASFDQNYRASLTSILSRALSL